ncbi:MAG: hypothetical protein LC624_08680 [Halobacteriales archaeon]|nr:hypothetical protein [Halobacteriales archaeon]
MADDLPRELRKLHELDREEHMRAAKAQGLTEAEARRHVNSEMRELDDLERAELHTPGMPDDRPLPGDLRAAKAAKEAAKGRPGEAAREPDA